MLRLAAAAATAAALFTVWPAAALAAGEPIGVTGIPLDARVELAWQPVTGATSYNVYRATTPTGITTPLATGVLTSFYTDTSAVNDTTYYYVVRSVTGGVESGDSPVVQSTARPRSCATGNETRLENCYPGNSAWTLQNPNAPSGIDGFATASSINVGESVDLKISVDSPSTPYRLEIYRSGYYNGVQARLFSVISGLAGGPQPACANDAPTGLVDCSNWTRSATIVTTGSWPSGIYFARMVRADNGSDNYVPFVVRDDARHSELLYGAGFATYQAYNNFGGKSLYDFNSTGGVTVAGTTRAVKVSYDRPYAQARGGGHNFYFVTESAWVSWLEEQGYDIAYQSDTDLERNGARVRDHRIYILPAHDEYYSSGMRNALEQGRDAGVNLFSGGSNQVYWKIRFESGAGGTDRVQVCYKSTQSGGADPSGISTGTWRDPAGANRPENALLGTMYVGDNDSQNFPLVVTAAQSADPIYRGTTLANSTSDTTIGSSIVGWEWDARVANGSEPAGVVTLSSSPVSGNLIQNNGANGAPGSTTAHAVKYRAPAPSNALVFAAGTNLWAQGLAGTIYAPGSPDARIQQTTMNVLTDMGATPLTPAAGVRIIATPAGGGGGDPGGGITPTVIEKVPGDGSANVSTNASVRAIFSTDMNASTITPATFTLAPAAGGANVAATVSYDVPSRTATLTPSAPLVLGVSYRASLSPTVLSSTNQPLTATTWTFTTPSCPCALFPNTSLPVSQNNPTQDGRSGPGPWSYELGVRVTVDQPMRVSALRFFKSLQEGGIHTGKIWDGSGAVIAQAEFAVETASGWQQQALATPLTLQPGQTYVVSVNANDFFGFTSGGLASQVTSGPLHTVVGGNGVFGAAAGVFPSSSFGNSNYFVDLEVVDTGTPVAPFVTAVSPRSGSATATAGTEVSATFSTGMNAASIDGTTFRLTGAGGAAVPGTVSYVPTARKAVFTPTAPLGQATSYTATLAQSISDTGGRALASPVSWTFTTTSACVCSFFPSTLTPASLDNPTQDNRIGPGPWSREFGLKFTVSQPTRLTAFRYYRTPAERGSHTGKLWANGALVTQAVFATESASGWQHQALATPVVLQPGTSYTISVNANDFFAVTIGGLATQANAGPAQTIVGENGVFSDAAGLLPTQNFNSGNYFVDLQVADSGLEPAPAPTDASPRGGDEQVATTSPVRVTFSRDLDATTVTGASFTLARPDGSTVPATVTYHAPSRTATLTPIAALADRTRYTANLAASIRAASGGPTVDGPIAWSFTTTDSTPPDTTITVAPSSPTAATSATFQFTSTTPGGTFECVLDGGTAAACTSPLTVGPLADGTHTFSVTAIDASGRRDPTSATHSWTIDTTGPAASITSPTPPTTSTNASFSFSAGEAGASFVCSLDGAAFSPCTSPASYTSLGQGSHTFRVRAVDALGNAGPPASSTWAIDSLAPDTTISGGPSPFTSSTSASIAFSSSEPGSTFACSLDGGTPIACTTPATYSVLADGNHTVRVTATDAAGNADPTPATTSWTVDTVAANTTLGTTPTNPTTSTSASFTFSSTETPATSECRIDGSAYAACTSPKDYTGLAVGSHTFDVRAIDAAGNADTTPASFTWTINAVPTGPTASSFSPAADATDVPNNVKPTITFAQPMDSLSITRTSFTLTPAGGAAVLATVSYNATTLTATMTPSKPLDYSKVYTLKADTTIKTSGGVPLAAPITWSFTSSGVAWTKRVNTGGAAYNSPSGASFMADTPVSGSLTISGGLTRSTTSTIGGTTDQPLYKDERFGVFTENIIVPNGTYDVRLHFAETQNAAIGARKFNVDILDTTGTDIANLDIRAAAGLNTALVKTVTGVVATASVIRVSTVAVVGDPVISAIEVLPTTPKVTSTTPANGATGVARGSTVKAVFNRTMDAASITGATFKLTAPGGAAVTATVAYDAATKTANLTPTSTLAANTAYTATVADSVRGSDGMVMGAASTWSFTTGP